MSKVKRPSNQLLFTEVTFGSSGGKASPAYRNPNEHWWVNGENDWAAALRHKGRSIINLTFLDGHAASWGSSRLISEPNSTWYPYSKDLRFRWRNAHSASFSIRRRAESRS